MAPLAPLMGADDRPVVLCMEKFLAYGIWGQAGSVGRVDELCAAVEGASYGSRGCLFHYDCYFFEKSES